MALHATAEQLKGFLEGGGGEETCPQISVTYIRTHQCGSLYFACNYTGGFLHSSAGVYSEQDRCGFTKWQCSVTCECNV